MIQVSEVSRSFATRRGTVHALRSVSLDVPEGCFYTLLGPSGCGKTTLLRCVAGLERPDAGDIVLGSRTVWSTDRQIDVPPHRRGIAMVFQSYAIWPHLSVFENVAFPLTVHRPRPARQEIQHRVEEALELVGLGALGDRSATALSGGQQQRVALARAVVAQPDILLLDEPLSNLDASLREQMRVEILRLQRRLGMTALYVTHDQSEALAMSDRIAVLSAGQVIQEGPPQAIYGTPRSRFVAEFVGRANVLAGTWKVPPAQGRGEAVLSCGLGDLACLATLPSGGRTPTGGDAPGDASRGGSGDGLGSVSGGGAEEGGPPAGRGLVVIRPEAIQLTATAPENAPNVFRGTVSAAQFLGSQTEYQMDVGGHVLRVQASGAPVLAPGGTAFVHIPPEACRAVDEGA